MEENLQKSNKNKKISKIIATNICLILALIFGIIGVVINNSVLIGIGCFFIFIELIICLIK